MNNYPEFKREYIATLTELLNERADTSDLYIGPSPIGDLTSKLADLEELHPIWTERVEDQLAEEQLAKGFTYHLNV